MTGKSPNELPQLSLDWLTSRVFDFRAGPSRQLLASSLQFERNGRISGYAHPNESTWRIDAGKLVVLRVDGVPTCIAIPTRNDDGTISLIGSFLLSTNNVLHCFTERFDAIRSIQNEFILAETAKFEIDNSLITHTIPPTFAQCGEDIIVCSLLRAHLAKTRRGWNSVFYIEIGANHPISTSNTYCLYHKFGATGILVEPNPDLHDDISKVRPRDTLVSVVVLPEASAGATLYLGNAHELSSVRSDHIASFGAFGGIGGIKDKLEVPAMEVNEFLAKYACSKPIDFLSVDCEGIDYELLCAIDFETYKPLIVQCEPSEQFHPGNGAKIVKLLESRSYRFIAETDVNRIFLRY